jgi:hypothetical protein
LNKLEEQREKIRADKPDLFDFYNDNWDDLISEIVSLRQLNNVDHSDPRQDPNIFDQDDSFESNFLDRYTF